MSRKGNSLDNGLIESFFGLMKSKMFYGQENNYKNIEDLKLAIEEYIDYYNNKRINSCRIQESILINQQLNNMSKKKDSLHT